MSEADKPKKKPEQKDVVVRELTLGVQGTNIDTMVEQARIQAARIFQEPLKNIQIIAGSPSIVSYARFQTDLSGPKKPDELHISVTARVKDKDEDQIEQSD